MKTIGFEHDIGDTVLILGCDNAKGVVAAMCFDKQGIGYRIVWWNDGKRLDEWMFPFEIKSSSNANLTGSLKPEGDKHE